MGPMPIVPEAVIEEIRSRTDIVQVIGDRISLKRSSGGFVACCPFHHEKTPSFHVNVQRQRYHCFGCGEDGDVFKFLMKHDGMAFLDAVRLLGEKCGVEVTLGEDDGRTARARRLYQINAEAAAFFRRCLLRTPGAAAARAYLERRRIPEDVAEAFGIGYDPDMWGALDGFARANRFSLREMVEAGLGTLPENAGPEARLRDRFHGRLMFPIADHTGRVVAFSGRVLDAAQSPAKYVNSPETDVFKKARVLYALDKAQRHIASAPHREAIVCEGQIDVIRCHACGFPRAVASEGTAFTPEHAKLLHRYADSAVLLFDADAAGRKAAVRTAAILLAEGLPVRVARMPAGEDPDSFLLKNPPDAFQAMLDAAVGIVPFHIDFLREQERDPDGADAAARIVQGVLQTVAASRNAVQKARMVQEVAALMRLPEDAVRDELAGVEETLRRQQASAERREAARAQMPQGGGGARPPAAPADPAAAAPVPAPPAMPPPPDLPPPELFDEPDRGPPGPEPAPADPPPDALDVAVCEFLLNHCLEEPGTLNAISRLMPSSIFPSGMMRRILEAFYASVGASTDPVYDLQQAEPRIADFLGAVAARHDRTGTMENYLARDVARDLVLRAWRRHLKRRLEASKAGGDGFDLAKMRERQEANRTLRLLRDWSTGEAAVHLLAGLPPPEAPASSDPASPPAQTSAPAPASPPAQTSAPAPASPSAPAAPSAADEAVFHPFVFPAPGAGPSAPSIETPPPESAEDDYDDLPPDDL